MYFDLVEFGKRVRELRVKNSLSQEALAFKLGISVTHYRHLEYGIKGCSVDLLLLLAEVFSVSTDYLLTGTSIGRESEIEELQNVIDTLTKMVQELKNNA